NAPRPRRSHESSAIKILVGSRSPMLSVLICECLLRSHKDRIVGLLGAVLRQSLGLFGEAHGVKHGRIVLMREIAAQPEQERPSVLTRSLGPKLVTRHGREVDRRQRFMLCVHPLKRTGQYEEAQYCH